METQEKQIMVCPKCGCDDIGSGHHEGDWYLPEFSWYECVECELRFGGDGAYENVEPAYANGTSNLPAEEASDEQV